MPTPNPYRGTRYEHDPLMQQALERAGGPALEGLRPSTRGSVYESLAALAQWMGMALPGRGGVNIKSQSLVPYMKEIFGRLPALQHRLNRIPGEIVMTEATTASPETWGHAVPAGWPDLFGGLSVPRARALPEGVAVSISPTIPTDAQRFVTLLHELGHTLYGAENAMRAKQPVTLQGMTRSVPSGDVPWWPSLAKAKAILSAHPRHTTPLGSEWLARKGINTLGENLSGSALNLWPQSSYVRHGAVESEAINQALSSGLIR